MDGRTTIGVWSPKKPSITADTFCFSSFNDGGSGDIPTKAGTGFQTNTGMWMRGRDGFSPTKDPSSGNTIKPKSNAISKSKEQQAPTTGIYCIGANDSEPIPCLMDRWESS